MSLAEVLPQNLDDSKTMKLGEVATLLGVSTKTIHEWAKAGRLPKPTPLGPRTYIFRVKELREALQRMDQQQEKPKRRK